MRIDSAISNSIDYWSALGAIERVLFRGKSPIRLKLHTTCVPIDPDYRETWRAIDRHGSFDIWKSPEDDSAIYGTKVGVHLASCTFCLKCVKICPTDVFESHMTSDNQKVVIPEREGKCIECLACEMVCPTDAISIDSRSGSESTLKALLDGE